MPATRTTTALPFHPLPVEQVGWLASWHDIDDEQVAVVKTYVRELLANYGVSHIDTTQPLQVGVRHWPQNTELPVEGYLLHVQQPEQDVTYSIDLFVDGTLSSLREVKPVDVEAVRALCELRTFPVAIGADHVLSVDKTEVLLDGHTLTHRHVYGEPNESHTALCVYGERDFASDRVLRLEALDQSERGLVALLFVRYAWGMNVHVALLDAEKRVLYHGGSSNYDHPTGEAMRILPAPDETGKPVVQLYTSNDDVDRRTLFSTEQPIVTFDNFYGNGGWRRWPAAQKLDNLGQLVEYVRAHPDFTSGVCDHLDQLNRRMEKAITDGQRNEEALALGREYLAFPGNSTVNLGFISNGPPTAVNVRYNVACVEVRLGHADAAMNELLRLEQDDIWDKWEHTSKDADLVSLHARDDFKQLLARHAVELA
jgi:hypothetical protein